MQDTEQGSNGSGSIDWNGTYARVVRRYHRLAQHDRQDGLVSQDVPLQLHMVHLYLVEKEGLAPATRRVYRNALVQGFLDEGSEPAFQALDILYGVTPVDATLLDLLQERHARPQRRKQHKTTTASKPCPAVHLASFLQALLASRSKWSVAAAEFYLAGVFTGLRPHAWRGARRTVIAGIPALVLTGTRRTDAIEPSAWAVRMLHDLTPSQIALIDRHLARVHMHGSNDQFHSLYEACRQLVRDTAARTVPTAYSSPSLDTARDLFRTSAGLAIGQNTALYTVWHPTSSPRPDSLDGDKGGDGGSASG